MGSPRVDVVFRLWQCDKENQGWREGPLLTVSWQSFDLLAGPSPSGKVSFGRKKNTALRRCPRAPHLRHWPVISDQPAAIGQCYGARPDFGLIVDITTTHPWRAWAPIIAPTESRNFGTTYQASINLEMVFFLCGRSAAAVRSGP